MVMEGKIWSVSGPSRRPEKLQGRYLSLRFLPQGLI